MKAGQSLGLMVRGGREFGLGIYISGVDPLSVADQAGMKVIELSMCWNMVEIW